MKKVVRRYILLGIIAIISMLGIIPVFNSLNYGLDLQGGFEVLYQIDSLDGEEVTKDMITNTYKTIEKRVNTLGVSEPNIVIEGNNIRVQLAGIKSKEEARTLLSKTASLTFRDVNDNLLMNASVIGGAKVSQDQYGNPAVALTVNDKETFYNVTKEISERTNNENMIIIWLDYEDTDSYEQNRYTCGKDDSRCLSAASVSQAFASDVIIQGNFKLEEVETLVNLINSGSLQTKLTEISSKTVDAEFGLNALNKTLLAGAIGILLIIIVMICLYHVCGIISSVSILLYMLITLATFWLVGGVLTLPGIAALVIGIGMAVDSSVISYARIRDELYEGRSLSNAFKNGIKTSFGTILDSNLTTLIVAIILFMFGQSSVKGFATMLIISIFVTMLVMVLINKHLLKMFVDTKYFDNKQNLFIRINTKDIPNIKKNEKRKKYYYEKIDFAKQISKVIITLLVVITVGVVSLVLNKLNLGIDFMGGSSISINTKEDINIDLVKEDLESLGYTFYDYEETQDGLVVVTISETLDEQQVINSSTYFQEKYNATTDIGVVSNIVKQELIKNAIVSLLLACLGIILYVSIRFRFSYAISGLIALFHDVFVIIAVFSLTKLEVSTIFIAAILSIVGYSINDTIVCFDRIREVMKKKFNNEIKNKEELKEVINISLRESLNRTIVTTVTTLLPVICLIIFGSHEIMNFNIALLIGLVAGTLSSLLLSTSIWYLIEKNNIGKVRKNDFDDEDEEMKIKGINA